MRFYWRGKQPFVSADAALSLKAAGYIVPTITKREALTQLTESETSETTLHSGKVFRVAGLDDYSLMRINGEYYLMPHIAREQLKWGKSCYVKPAYNVNTGKKIALKVTLFTSSQYVTTLSPDEQERFKDTIRERRQLEKFNLFKGEKQRESKTQYTSHPLPAKGQGNPVKLKKYMGVPFAEGVPLDGYLKGTVDTDFSTLVTQSLLICKAIKAIHKKNSVHLDIKGSNVHWDSISRRITVIDYNCMHETQEKITGIVGSPGFTAPEILLCVKKNSAGETKFSADLSATSKMDVYSLGILLKALLSKNKQHFYENKQYVNNFSKSFFHLKDLHADACPELIKPCCDLTTILNSMTLENPKDRSNIDVIISALERIRTPEHIYRDVLSLSKKTAYFWKHRNIEKRLNSLLDEINESFKNTPSNYERILLSKSLFNIFHMSDALGDGFAIMFKDKIRNALKEHMTWPLDHLRFYIIENLEQKISKLKYGGVIKEVKVRALQQLIREVESDNNVDSLKMRLVNAKDETTSIGAALTAKRSFFSWGKKKVDKNPENASDCVNMVDTLISKCHAFSKKDSSEVYVPQSYKPSWF